MEILLTFLFKKESLLDKSNKNGKIKLWIYGGGKMSDDLIIDMKSEDKKVIVQALQMA